MADYAQLFNEVIPQGRDALVKSHENLQAVAKYVTENFDKASDKQKALDEGKQFTRDALASVAYQVHGLACAVSDLLNEQVAELDSIKSNVSTISQRLSLYHYGIGRNEMKSFLLENASHRSKKVRLGGGALTFVRLLVFIKMLPL